RDYDSAIVGNQLAALWPSLNDEILNKKPKSSHQTRTLQLPVEKLPSPELKADGKVRFPWAARLSPQSRNLYRAATPTYRLDGTPQISIPSKVLKLGPENKDEYIIGKFHRCTLPPDDRSDIPVVDIDVILQQRDSMTAKSSPNGNPTTPKVLEDKDIVEPSQQPLLVVDHGASANHSYHSDFDQETSNTLSGTRSPSSHLQHKKPATMLMAVTIPSTLIMESFPSNITNSVALGSSGVGAFITSPVHCAFESPHFTVLGDDVDEVEIEPSSQFSLTRGGRESKAPIKYHNMEWKTVRGRGKRDRRGRGSSQ
ncbi:unnamed protein product, partial [Brassica rapa]